MGVWERGNSLVRVRRNLSDARSFVHPRRDGTRPAPVIEVPSRAPDVLIMSGMPVRTSRVPPLGVRRRVLLLLAALALGGAHPVAAQSAADLAAWDALIVSPVGAFAPLARDGLVAGGDPQTELALRYGRWRYDLDDAIHNDLGLTLSRRLGSMHVALTMEFLSLSCGTCGSWIGAGVEANRTIFARRLAGPVASPLLLTAGVSGSAGIARFQGDGAATGRSATVSAPMGLAFGLSGASRVALSVVPGIGVGRFSSADESAHGTRPMLGLALAAMLGPHLVVDVGTQRILIDAGPTALGGGLAWH
jgi:hypothetical protein